MRAASCSKAALGPLLAALCAAGVQAQDQTPVFRSGVEVMEVDVAVLDGKGVPLRDLSSGDFTVTVDGQPRRVISSEFIADGSGEAPKPVAPRDPYVSNNTDRRPGRLIMLAIDRNNTDTITLRGTIAALKTFVAGLSPDDRLGVVTIPPPGPTVDFTTNREQIFQAISRVMGSDDAMPSRFNVSDYEAISFADRTNPMVTQRLLGRVCGDTDPTTLSNCDRDVEQEALTLAAQLRQRTSESVSGFGALLRNLRDVEGAKSLVILSQGLMLEGANSEATALALLAAEARVSVNVLLFDAPRGVASQSRISETGSQDRDLRESGLESLASRSRGALFRVMANPEYVFDRLKTEISAYYMLGVEPTERDRDGKAHQIRVQVRREGVQVRARRQVQYTVRTPNTWSRDVLMGKVLRSPSANTQLPMRLSTYVFQDPAPGKNKLIMSAEIDPESMQKDLDLAIGFVIYDKLGTVLASGQERKIYSSNSDLPIKYDLTIAVNPGSYRVRLAAIDIDGNSGSVERDVQAFQTRQPGVVVGDLILTAPKQGSSGDMRPPVVLQVKEGAVGTYTEIYTSKPGALEGTDVIFEIADSEEGPALQSSQADLRERPDQTMRQAGAIIPVGSLPPGRYIARAIVTEGGKVIGKTTRPLEVFPTIRPASPVAKTEPATRTASDVAPPPAPMANAGSMVAARPSAFNRGDVLKPEMLRAAYDVIEKAHPSAKAALARARGGQLEGTALMALDAGDQSAGALLRGLEFLSKGQLDPAANQFGVALRNHADSGIASFYLGACYASVGRDKEAVSAWERARATELSLPGMPVVIADGWLRLGQPANAIEPLKEALAKQPQNDAVRRNLAIAQSHMGLHEDAYRTITPFLEKNPSDADALLVALQALYQVHVEGKTIGNAEDDRTKSAQYAKAYAAANGPSQPLVEKWAEFLAR